VSRREGEPWKDKLLALPAFLREPCDPSPQDIADGFALTGFFLLRHALEPRGLGFADARENFIAALERDGRAGRLSTPGPSPMVITTSDGGDATASASGNGSGASTRVRSPD
jgi:hypothetical protein